MTDYFNTDQAGTLFSPDDVFIAGDGSDTGFDTGWLGQPAWDPTTPPVDTGISDPGWQVPTDYMPDPGLFPPASESPPADAFYQPIPDVQVSPVDTGGGFSLQNLTAAALAALQLVRAYQQTGGQIQNPTAANRAASASSGTIITRSASGAVQSTRPPVGVATVTSDGGLIVNNGNGTFDYVSPTGQRTTRSYGGTGAAGGGGVPTLPGGLSTNTLLIGGAAVLALLMLKGK